MSGNEYDYPKYADESNKNGVRNDSTIQGNYAQDNYAQDNYAQDNYAQENYAPGNYAQDNYAQDNYAQEKYAPGNYAQDNYAQDTYEQKNYPQENYDANAGKSEKTDNSDTKPKANDEYYNAEATKKVENKTEEYKTNPLSSNLQDTKISINAESKYKKSNKRNLMPLITYSAVILMIFIIVYTVIDSPEAPSPPATSECVSNGTACPFCLEYKRGPDNCLTCQCETEAGESEVDQAYSNPEYLKDDKQQRHQAQQQQQQEQEQAMASSVEEDYLCSSSVGACKEPCTHNQYSGRCILCYCREATDGMLVN